ncbi:hypothetical protein GCM10020000_31320 [Streptomyces olivoverticillatus]
MTQSARGARSTESGLPIEPVYGPDALIGWEPADKLGEPGSYPYTRGVYPTMYTGRPWTMRQYAGFGTAAESNARYRQLIEHGTHGLSVAFDLPTQMGHDSDAPLASGEVGKVGVAVDSVEDMRVLFDGIPLGEVSTSMTINAPAALLLLMYQLVAEEQGVPAEHLTGTIQNDVLKEYIARGTYIFPPQPSLRLTADIFRYCRTELPRWNTISISGYHMAEAQRLARAGDRLHARERHRVRPYGRRRSAWTSTTSPRGSPSSSSPGRRCWRRSRSSARHAASGPG